MRPGENSAEAEAFRRRYGLDTRTPPAPVATAEAAPGAPGVEGTPGAARVRKPKGDAGETSSITITFRAVSWTAVSPDANKATAIAVVDELRNSPMFDPSPDETKIPSGDVGNEEPPGTFTFVVVAKLKRPLRL